MRAPPGLPHRIGSQHRAPDSTVLDIDPTLFGARQMCAVSRERQQVGQHRHKKSVSEAVRNSQHSPLGRSRFRLRFDVGHGCKCPKSRDRRFRLSSEVCLTFLFRFQKIEIAPQVCLRDVLEEELPVAAIVFRRGLHETRAAAAQFLACNTES